MKKTLLSLAVASLLSADTTMCFKENWTDMANIENIALSGGKCENKYSVSDMKTDGWRVEDIKISSGKSGMSYMYIFKKGGSVVLNDNDLETRLNAIQDKRETKKKAEIVAKAKANGEKIYKTICAKCHGVNGELEAYNTSRALNTMTKDEIEVSMREYEDGDKDNGRAMMMIPYANKLSPKELDAVISYIETFK